jgi:hypothetical protein
MMNNKQQIARWREEQYTIADIDPLVIFDMLDMLEQQQAQIEQLRKAIKEHNDECEALCQPEQCGYAKYARDCPNCPKQNLIDTKQLKNGSNDE